jgi:hypothetical protein
MKPRGLRHAWLITIFWLAGTAPAQGQPEPTPRPWERDVSVEDRRLAETLFAQAVELHEQLLRDQAMARYEEALSHWENPHIRWNLALLMKEMGQYLLAWEHLEAALVWGPEAFDEHDRDKLLAMRQMLLRQHLAVVEARCDQPGAEVALDGKPWFRGPGEARQVVLPGEHVITAWKPGYFPVTRTIVLSAGARGVVTIAMFVDRFIEKRRWQPWMPWVVIGAGVAAGMVGAGLDWHADRQLAQARRDLARECGNALSCAPAIPSSYGRALWGHRIGTGAMVVGGTAAAAGLALVLLNQPRAYRTAHRDSGAFELMPMVSPDIAGVSAQFRF